MSKKRDPIQAVSSIRSNLPFLILQGAKDLRVELQEGRNMVQKLEINGNPVTYIEFSDGDHCLTNTQNRMDIIADWFAEES